MLTKKSKIMIAVAVILVVAIIIGIIVGIIIWKERRTIPGNHNLINQHYMTISEAHAIKRFLPLPLLLPSHLDGDIEFVYGNLGMYEGIDKDKLIEIKKIIATSNDYSKISKNDFKHLSSCYMTVKKEGFDIVYSCHYQKWYPYDEPIIYFPKEKDEKNLNINIKYYSGFFWMYQVSIYPNNYEDKLGDKGWWQLTKEEKIELYGRDWFDKCSLDDIDNFMKEVCAYNGINSDWLDNKPIYSVKW